MKFFHLVAVNDANVIGINNELPWKSPLDLQVFRNMTRGKLLVMGSNTYISIGKGKGPEAFLLSEDRKIIVLSNNLQQGAVEKNVTVVDYPVEDSRRLDLEEILLGLGIDPDEEVIVVGGEKVYSATTHLVSARYRTLVDHDVEVAEGDVVSRYPYGINQIARCAPNPLTGPKLKFVVNAGEHVNPNDVLPDYIHAIATACLYQNKSVIDRDLVIGLNNMFMLLDVEHRNKMMFRLLGSFLETVKKTDYSDKIPGSVHWVKPFEKRDGQKGFEFRLEVGNQKDGSVPLFITVYPESSEIELLYEQWEFCTKNLPLTALDSDYKAGSLEAKVDPHQSLLFFTCLFQLILRDNPLRMEKLYADKMNANNILPTLGVITGLMK